MVFALFEAVASIWLNGSYHTTEEPDRSELPWETIHWRRWERSVSMRETNLQGAPLRTLPGEVGARAGHYERKLETKAGGVKLRIPNLRRLPFETAIIERYKRRMRSISVLVAIGVGTDGFRQIRPALIFTRRLR